MKRYEYKVVRTIFLLERKLNQLGDEGWKVVAGTKGSLIMMRESEN